MSSACVSAQNGTCNGLAVGQLTSLNGFVPFPASNLWNTGISAAPVDPNSANIMNYIGETATLHPDFGPGGFMTHTGGIPYQVVAVTQPKVEVLVSSGSESDPGPMPVPLNALIEGFPTPGNGDRHVLVLEKSGCWLYELYKVYLNGETWSARSTAIWDMMINEQRPYTWTSADAAGLPIFAGLARYDEVASGAIKHALRFTVPNTRRAFVAPASHWASTITDVDAPPMGTRLRLKVSFDIASFPADDRVILTALKKYGMILADNGGAIYITGAPDTRWNNNDLNLLKTLTGSDFEVVHMGTVYTDANLPKGPPPTISHFTANPSAVAPGSLVTLNWSVANSIYNIISPQVGPVRGTSIVVTPSATTTYTLYATNRFGRTTASVSVTVR